ncbi:MAG: MFS transporter [Chloroflexi bacterium]|jgi:predicted MFS family arabinose efflux permease|nr:MFS transporter [Dehalococcoidia bacterium]PKB85186.1 MAG: MFS transporter [SAR202 cluster bacterium MP-NPac-SRR3961935-G1]RUA29907.1 MAG: MFS transporter [Chloroflexota bacterium]
MAETNPQITDRESRRIRDTAPFVLTGLSAGHGIFHWFSQSFFVMLPEVVATFGLNGLQVGAISATREVVSGIIALPGGVVTDMVRRHWGLVLAGCMGLFGVGWLIMGISPVYPVLLVGMAAVAAAAAMWHLPAAAALSQRFADRRGSALSIHGVGGNIGDVLGPALTGVLLLTLSWRGVVSIYAVVPMLLVFIVFWAFRDIGRTGSIDTAPPQFREQMSNTRQSFKDHPRLWGIMAVAGLRGMANVAFLPFLALYLGLDEELDLGNAALGLHIALLVGVGVVAAPVVGYISDRAGRKLVLIPGMLALCALTALLVPFGEGAGLIIILALLGVFFFSDQPILTAAALDVVGDKVAASTLGVFSFSRFVLAAASPLIAGELFDEVGIESTFFFVASIYLLATVVLIAVPLSTPPDRSDVDSGGN